MHYHNVRRKPLLAGGGRGKGRCALLREDWERRRTSSTSQDEKNVAPSHAKHRTAESRLKICGRLHFGPSHHRIHNICLIVRSIIDDAGSRPDRCRWSTTVPKVLSFDLKSPALFFMPVLQPIAWTMRIKKCLRFRPRCGTGGLHAVRRPKCHADPGHSGSCAF